MLYYYSTTELELVVKGKHTSGTPDSALEFGKDSKWKLHY